MTIWLSIQIFQSMFGAPIAGDALIILKILSYMELLAEIVFIIGSIIYRVVNNLGDGGDY